MATTNTATELGALLKNVYANGVVEAYGFDAPLMSRLIKFDYQEAGIGNTYNQPVELKLEHSITSSAADVTPTFLALNAGISQNAISGGMQKFGRASVNYDMLERARAAGPKAFESAGKRVTKRLALSHLKRLEIECSTGRRGIAKGSAISGTSTTRALVVSAETWSAARFAGMEGATLTSTDSDGTTARAPVTGAVSTFYLVSVDTTTRTLNVAGNSTDMTSLDTSWPAGGWLFFESNGTGATGSPELGGTTEMAGLDAWCNMSGTWFNIVTGTYSLWNPNVYSTSTGVIGYGKLFEAIEMIGAYGRVKKLVALCSLKAFGVLNTDIAALRNYDSSYKQTKGAMGNSGLEFSTSVGTVELLPHPFQSDGIIHIFAPDEVLRTGACDIKFIQRGDGSGSNNIVLESSTTPAGEMRTHSNQQMFCEQPRHLALLSGITFG